MCFRYDKQRTIYGIQEKKTKLYFLLTNNMCKVLALIIE